MPNYIKAIRKDGFYLINRPSKEYNLAHKELLMTGEQGPKFDSAHPDELHELEMIGGNFYRREPRAEGVVLVPVDVDDSLIDPAWLPQVIEPGTKSTPNDDIEIDGERYPRNYFG